jgi:hypothetical protein
MYNIGPRFQVFEVGLLHSNPVRLQAALPGAAVHEHRATADARKNVLKNCDRKMKILFFSSKGFQKISDLKCLAVPVLL